MLLKLLEERRERLNFIDRHCSSMVTPKIRRIVQTRSELIRRIIPLTVVALKARENMTCLERLIESRNYYQEKGLPPSPRCLQTAADYREILEQLNSYSHRGASGSLAPSFVLQMARIILFSSPENICGDRYIVTEVLDKDTPVYEAIDIYTKTHVAIKVLGPHLSSTEEIKLTRLASEISNTFIKFIALEPAPFVEPRSENKVFRHQSSLAIVMERCGTSLFTLMGNMQSANTPCPIGMFRSIFLPVCRALEKLHERGILHCDIKMDNILFNNGEPRIIDMGLAMLTGSKSNRGTLFTVGHIPPELAFLAKDKIVLYESADIFALGVTMLRVALPSAGELFGTTTKASYDRGRARIAKYLKRICEESSLELANFILPLLDFDPTKRPSAKSLANDPFLLGLPVHPAESSGLCFPCFEFCADYCDSSLEDATPLFRAVTEVDGPASIDIGQFLRNVPDSPDLVVQYCCLIEHQDYFSECLPFHEETKYY